MQIYTIRIIGRDDTVGGGWKDFAKSIMWSLCLMI